MRNQTQDVFDRVAIVTGAGKDIGQATAIAFSARGVRRIAESEEVAAAAAWLWSDAASYIPGAVLPIDGGMTL